MASSPSDKAWQDRRGMFQKGKELHTPSNPTGRKFSETGVTSAVRRASTSSNNGGSPVDAKPVGGAFPVAGSGRRRSSAAGSGLFGSLQAAKRGSEDYGERRQNTADMQGGGGGMMSGWFNSTFKGHQKPADK